MRMIPIMSGALDAIPKRLVRRLEDFEVKRQVETIQAKVLLRSVRILRRVLDT